MSYDLYFKSRTPTSKLNVETMAAYFRNHANYEVTDKQAIYQNDTTGVYFMFDLGDVGNEEQLDLIPISFNLNYYRPHIFGLEAEREVSSFVKHFNLTVSDGQLEGMSDGEYSTEGFLRGWNHGNEFGYRAILQQNANENPLTLSTERIEACWRWNFTREELQKKLGGNVFVPRFMFIAREGKIARTIVWPDGIPIAIPEADFILVPRKTILPKKFFRAQEDTVIATWSEINPIVSQFSLQQGALPYRLPQYSSPPSDIVSQVRKLTPTDEKPQGVSVDKILNSELVAKARIK